MSLSLIEKLAFWKSSKHSDAIGVYVAKTSLWVSVIPSSASISQSGKAQSFELPFSDNNWFSAFKTLAKQYPKAKLQLILGTGRYQLLQTDQPQVSEDDLSQALLWSIKNLVNLPLDNIHLDYFFSPVENSGKVNVVICDKKEMQTIAFAAQETGLEISGISIEELALSNIHKQDNQARLLLCHQQNNELMLAIIKNGDLYLQRQIRGFHGLSSIIQEEVLLNAADNLSLEIQRSMDFYESQLRQAPIGEINLLIEGVADQLAPLLANNFSQSVQVLQQENLQILIAKLALEELSREGQV